MPALPLFPVEASTMAGKVDALYFFLIAVSAFFVVLIAGLIVFFSIRYRRRAKDEIGTRVVPSLALELTWTIIPLCLGLVMFAWGASLYFTESRPPAETLDVYVVGKQWMWKFQHLDGRREIDELHIPVGRAVRLTGTSEDGRAVAAMLTSTDSFAGVATRVIARTLEYENSPLANAALISGSDSSARATRTFSRAATLPMPHCQLSHCAVLTRPCRAYASLRSNSATSSEEAIGRGVQVAPELGDLGFEAVERGVVGCSERSERGGKRQSKSRPWASTCRLVGYPVYCRRMADFSMAYDPQSGVVRLGRLVTDASARKD